MGIKTIYGLTHLNKATLLLIQLNQAKINKTIQF